MALEILIKTFADLAGLDRVDNRLRSTQGTVNLASQALGQLQQVFARLDRAIRAYEEEAVALGQVQQSLTNAGFAASDFTHSFSALGSELQNVTGIAEHEWLGTINRLIQAGADPRSIGIDVEAVKNLAGRIGGDLSSATLVYTRALQGNFDVLSRYGIQIDDNLTKEEKLTRLREQAARGSGLLEKQMEGELGTYKRLKIAMGEVTEAIGNYTISNVNVRTAMELVTSAVEFYTNKLNEGAEAAKVGKTPLEQWDAIAKEIYRTANRAAAATQTLATTQQNAGQAARSTTDALQDQIRALNEAASRQVAAGDAEGGLALARLRLRRAQSPDTAESRAQFDLEEAALRLDIEERGLRRRIEAGRAGEAAVVGEAIRQGGLTPALRSRLADATRPIEGAEARLERIGVERGIAQAEFGTATARASRELAARTAQAREQDLRQIESEIRTIASGSAERLASSFGLLDGVLAQISQRVETIAAQVRHQRNQ